MTAPLNNDNGSRTIKNYNCYSVYVCVSVCVEHITL